MSDDSDVEVMVAHPFGDLWVPLSVWIANGPGPRPFVRPTRARRAGTREELALTDAVPLPYRNDAESRALIASGALTDPWTTA